MKTDFVEQEIRNVGTLEMAYRKVAEMVAPAELEENPTASARVYLAALALIPLETERESENRGGKEVNDA